MLRLLNGSWVWGWYSVTLVRRGKGFHCTLHYRWPVAWERLLLEALRIARRAGCQGRWQVAEARRIG